MKHLLKFGVLLALTMIVAMSCKPSQTFATQFWLAKDCDSPTEKIDSIANANNLNMQTNWFTWPASYLVTSDSAMLTTFTNTEIVEDTIYVFSVSSYKGSAKHDIKFRKEHRQQ